MKVTRRFFSSAFAVVLLPFVCRADNMVIRPTTTLSAETSNNTSAPNSFVAQPNGNLGANNTSKLDIHSLLYPAAQTKVFAHLVLWFGQPNHMNVGYSSTDPAQVKRQISDMISRGIDGVVMVWYGPDNDIDRAAKLVMSEAENHPGFTFTIMIDNGAIRWDSCAGCNPQQAFTQDLQYVEQTFIPSPAYLRVNGHPVITNFDVDLYYKIDWSAARAALATDPLFLFQNSGGFSHVLSGGAFSWDIPTTTDYGMSYLTSFYKSGLALSNQETWGASYKGFNDTLASWGLNRTMAQQCGQTWLQTFSKINSLYDSTHQLPVLQLVTWNDYEEGTEIESGIDNCVNISATLSGNSLNWSVAGNENTVDHYTVYLSGDGENLMPLAEVETASHDLDLCGYSLAPASYTLFVEAIGKPNLSNHMSKPVKYQPTCVVTSSPTIALSATPSSVTIPAGQSAVSRIMVSVQSAGLTAPLSLSCSNLPAGMSCSFSPAILTSGSGSDNSALGISVVRASINRKRPVRQPRRLFYSRFGPALDTQQITVPSIPIGLSPGAYSILVNVVSGTTRVSTPALVTVR